MNPKNIRLLSQQLVAPQFTRAVDVVRWFGFMQAQEQQMMRWACVMRTKHPSIQSFKEDFDAGRIVRTHLFRCTWQLVAGEDLRWMIPLCRERNKKAIEGYLKAYGRTLSEAKYEQTNEALRHLLQGKRSATRDELIKALAEQGISDDAHTMSIMLRRAESDGIICSGDLDTRQSTYALVDEKVPNNQPSLDHKEAVRELARRYFRSHAPATLDDFAWWTGLPRSACRDAIAALAIELHAECWQGDTYYIHHDSRRRGVCRDSVILLPSYDEYLIGYKSRHLVLDESFRHRAHNNSGIFHPVILHNGHVVGNWHPKNRSTDFFMPQYQTDTHKTFDKYERSMGIQVRHSRTRIK